MKQLILSFAMLSATAVMAQNPIIQLWATPDPAPYVHNDTVYLFTDHDEDEDIGYFNMKDWQLYSSTDMVNWTYRGTPLTPKAFSWSRADKDAWAAQAIERNGKWYWYVSCNDTAKNFHGIGVAVADRPEGPYTDPIGKPLVAGAYGFIDPTVFIDDDGQAYLFWGNNGLWYAPLNDDMISLKEDFKEIDTYDVNAFGPHKYATDWSKNMKRWLMGFEEAPWVYKRGDLYYIEYAAGGVPEHWAYSTAKNIHGPWIYRGKVMGESPNSFTIHEGSIRCVDFGRKSPRKFTACIKGRGGKIEVRIGSKEGRLLGTLNTPNTKGGWRTVSTRLEAANGVHDLYFVYRGDQSSLFEFDWWQMK